jgi:hypothetical protein
MVGQEGWMHFLALIYQRERTPKDFSKEEWAKIYAEYQAVGKELRDKGLLKAGYGLQPVAAARTVRSREGKVSIQEGPAYATEDGLSGVNLIEAPDMETALEAAAKLPSVRWGSIEVRPLMEYRNSQAETFKPRGS